MVILREYTEKIDKMSLGDEKRNIEGFNRDECENSTDCYGVAVDIGTTTVAMSLFSMKSGKNIDTLTRTNEQVALGSDVMMRIMHAVAGRQDKLHNLIIQQIEQMIQEMCERQYINRAEDIAYMTVVGNTTMCHLFLNRDVTGMKGAPFQTAYTGAVRCKGKEVGFCNYRETDIYVLSGVAAHIGADAVSMMCSEKIYQKDKVQVAVDIGTNAEIILNNHGIVKACSTAAGPAFEGQGIYCGMRAGSSAINGVKINKANGNIILDIIAPFQNIRGICGSGLVDVIAELLRIGLISSDGYLLSRKEAESLRIHSDIIQRLSSDEKGNYFILYDGKKDSIRQEKDIIITQKDIRNVQLAKGAIQAGVSVLLEEVSLQMKDIDEFIVAGVFGKFIHQSSAKIFGLFPNLEGEKLKFVGNAAGKGAMQALFDISFQKLSEDMAKNVEHIELADKNEFQSKFMGAMELKQW